MSVLGRATRRDLRRQRWQYASVTITVLLGVALFAGSYDAYLNLEASYEQTYTRLAFADMTVTGGDVVDFASRAADHTGVSAVATRREAEIPIRIDEDHTLLGRVVEMPDSGQPAVNQIDVLDGALPRADDAWAVSVERHMADHFDLIPGAQLEMLALDGWRRVDVAATAASPEYIWPARSRQDILTSPDDFGVVFASTSVFDQLAVAPVTEVAVRFVSTADADEVAAALTATARDTGAATIERREDQPSNAALQEDVSGFGELSFMFPMLFLGAATMATFILLNRLVRSQQAEIATLRANGLSARQVVLHYLGRGMVVTVTGGIAGLAIGVGLGRLVTGLYTDAITVPDTVTRFHASTIAVGLGLSLVAGALAAALPALGAGRIDPGVALRGTAPTRAGGRSIAERFVPPIRRLPTRWRMALRGIGRSRRRSLSTTVGVVLSLTLILTSWGMVDTVEILLDRQFEVIQLQDAQIYFDPAAEGTLEAIETTEGIERAEPVAQTSVLVEANGEQYATELIAFDHDTEMHDFGATGRLGTGLIVGRSLAGILGIDVGDDVTLIAAGGAVSLVLPVDGFVDEPLGTFVYGDRAEVRTLTDTSLTRSAMVTFADDVERNAMRGILTDLPGVLAYADSQALYDTAQSLLSLFYAFVGVMLAFGALMAFALIFNTATVNAAERSAELAAMKVNGVSSGQLARLMAAENLLLTSVSILPGLAIGYGVSAVFMDTFSSDLFDFGLQMRGRTLLLSALAIVIVSAVAQWPTKRAIDSLDVARVVRERSQ